MATQCHLAEHLQMVLTARGRLLGVSYVVTEHISPLDWLCSPVSSPASYCVAQLNKQCVLHSSELTDR